MSANDGNEFLQNRKQNVLEIGAIVYVAKVKHKWYFDEVIEDEHIKHQK